MQYDEVNRNYAIQAARLELMSSAGAKSITWTGAN